MQTLLLVLVIMAFYLPIHFLRRELAAQRSPDYWQRWGVVVVHPRALELRERVIGRYMDAEIFEHVRFHGLDYSYSRIAGPHERDAIEGGELYLEPGLIYRLVAVEAVPTSR